MPDREDLVAVSLTEEERYMLTFGLKDWDGPTEATESVAVALGFVSIEDLHIEGDRIAEAIHAGEPVSERDWSRALFATEVVFASKVVGAAAEWGSIHGGTDAGWIGVLRSLQRKVPASRRFVGS